MAKKKILVVENEGIVSLNIQNNLQSMGYQVVGRAASGKLAIQLAQDRLPDVVLMDIVLQGDMNGIQAAKKIHSRLNIPIIYLTAFADDRTVRQARATEPFGYIIKPFDNRELKTSIEMALFKAEIEKKLKDSEERFREIFEQNFDAIILIRPRDFRIIDVNPAAIHLFGYGKKEFSHGLHPIFINKNDFADFQTLFSEPARNVFFLEQFRFRKHDGSEIICSVKGNIIKLHKGNAIYCSFRDSTDKIKIENEVRKLQDNLIQADKMISLGILVSGVAHEINNPNNSIMLNLAVIQKAWKSVLPILDEYARREGDFKIGGMGYKIMKDKLPILFTSTTESSRRIQRIVNDLKRFSGKDPQGFWEVIDINSVLSTAITLIDNLVKKSTHSFHVHFGRNVPKIKGNFQNLEQVLVNLIQNSCQALTDPGQSIHVDVHFDPVRGVLITVEDEGRGMSEKDLKLIKEPFFTTRRSSGGTGLGLSVSDRIVRDHHGTLEITSREGKGTRAVITLPVINLKHEQEAQT